MGQISVCRKVYGIIRWKNCGWLISVGFGWFRLVSVGLVSVGFGWYWLVLVVFGENCFVGSKLHYAAGVAYAAACPRVRREVSHAEVCWRVFVGRGILMYKG